MTERKIRDIIGLILIIGHIIMFPMILYFYSMGGFRGEELSAAFAIIFPIFASHVLIVLQHFIKTRRDLEDNTPRVRRPYAIVLVIFTLAQTLSVAVIITLKAFNYISSFWVFATFLGGAEVIYGVFLAWIVDHLYSTD